MTRRTLLAAMPLALILMAGTAAAQAPAAPPLAWNAPPAEAAMQLERAGFRRLAGESRRYQAPRGGRFQEVAADTSQSTYSREKGRVSESVFIRRRAGQTVQMVYSATGDSASLQSKLEAVLADQAGRLGVAASQGPQRVWTMEGGRRLSVPVRPFALPDGATYQFMVLYHQP